jgi:hypothetical protein
VDLPRIFKKLLIANFIMVLVALPVYFTSYRDWMWYRNKFTHSVDGFYRLSLFTYEASYYALMFAPIAFYYLLKLSRSAFNVNSAFVLLITVLPLLLSLSIGVLGAMAFAFGIYYLIHQKEIFFRKSLFVPLFSLVACCFIVFSFLLIFWIDNPLFIRISNIFNGIDTSTNGRTTESIKIGWMVAQLKSTWFGAGVGQVKILAPDIIRSHFGYWGKPEVVRIPNTIGECIAIFGISGFLLKMGVLLFLFFKKKVMNNSYRLLLFLFMFFYQFTGSFVTNIVEYVAWILAFYGHFPEFDTSLTSKLLAEKNSE